jgi:hypothetical protein
VCGPEQCLPPKVVCPDGWCTDLYTDAFNCGTCGFVCPIGALCQGGVCTCAGTLCPDPVTGGLQCTALNSAEFCGSCDNKVRPGETG